jgi:hypothetical protein
MNKRLAKWIVVKAGNLAVRLAPHAGFDLVFRLRSHKRQTPPVVPPPVTGPAWFRAECKDCGDWFDFPGIEGASVLGQVCPTCDGRRWFVVPRLVDPQPHQGSRRQQS